MEPIQKYAASVDQRSSGKKLPMDQKLPGVDSGQAGKSQLYPAAIKSVKTMIDIFLTVLWIWLIISGIGIIIKKIGGF